MKDTPVIYTLVPGYSDFAAVFAPDLTQGRCSAALFAVLPIRNTCKKRKKMHFPHFFFLGVSWLKKKLKNGGREKRANIQYKISRLLDQISTFSGKSTHSETGHSDPNNQIQQFNSIPFSVAHPSEAHSADGLSRLTRRRMHLGGMGTLSCPLLSSLILMPDGYEMVMYHFWFTHMLAKP